MPSEPRKDDPVATPQQGAGFLASHQTQEKTVWLPWIAAAVVVVLGLALLVVFGGHGKRDNQVGGTGMMPPDPYAASLAWSDLQMSEATSFSGAKVTYVDGQITNSGVKTLTGITVQVGFHSPTGEYAQRLAVPLNLIRTRQPYIDTEPVSADPIAPGQRREFRLIFDEVPDEWNQQYPELRVIAIRAK